MAKYEAELRGDFDKILKDIDDAVLNRSLSASVEEKSRQSSDCLFFIG